MRFQLARDGEPQLAFDGELLVRMNSQAPGKKNWTELTLYRTNGGTYVVQTIARTTKPGEVEWFSARTHASEAEVVTGLRDRRRKTLSKLALALLESAAETNDAFADALDEVEGQEELIK
jgi:hypothetical protein